MATKNNKPIYIERALLRSKAYRSLRKTKSVPVLLDFYARRQMAHIKQGKKKQWICTNDGKIEFPYNEAVKKGYSPKQFIDAKRELVEHGFIDVTNEGGIYDGDTAKYSISERWRKYDTPEFEFKTISKDKRQGRGWPRYWEKQHEKFLEIIERRKRQKKMQHKRRKKNKLKV
jgi:hypothetical protein